MSFTSFSAVFAWVISHGYLLMLLGMLLEGPTVTMAAGLAASLHYFNPLYVFLLSIFGDVGPDALFYGLGYWGRFTLIEKFDIRLGLSKERLEKLENLAANHLYKLVAALKFTPFLATPGLLAIGATRASFKKFLTASFIITTTRSIIFVTIGYFFGKWYESFARSTARKDLLIISIFLLLILIGQIYQRLAKKLGTKVEKI